jgi:tyrosine-protein phosphatase YwqE
VYPDLYPNTTATIQAALASLQQGIAEAGLDVEVQAAAEYFIDDLFSERLDRKEPLLTIHKNWVLVEISFVSPPPDLHAIIFKLILNGYQPVLAHPERYGFYAPQPDVFHRFKDQGCFLQINLLSLLGYYGKTVQETARMLVKAELVDLVGTDLHHIRHLQAMNNPALMAEVDALLQSGRLLNPSL